MKHLSLIAGLAVAACAFAVAPKAAHSATEFTPYLDLRASLAYTYTKQKEGETNIFGKTDGGDPATAKKGKFFNFDNGSFLLGTSNVGAKFKADKIAGEAQILADKTANLDKYWLEYDAGVAKILIGKLDPMCTIWTNQAAYGWDGLGGYGVAWSGREKQVKVTIGGFYLDFMPANENADYVKDGSYVQTLGPKTNIGYNYAFGDSFVNFGAIGNYNKFRNDGKLLSDGTTKSASGKTLLSYMAYVNAKIIAGAVTLIATADYGMNEGNMGFGDYNLATDFYSAVLDDGKIKNTTSYEGALEVMYKVDPFSIGAGFGYVHSENSKWKDATLGTGKDNTRMSAYVEGIVPVNAYVTIYPEVSYFKTLKDPALDSSGEEAIWAGAMINYYL